MRQIIIFILASTLSGLAIAAQPVGVNLDRKIAHLSIISNSSNRVDVTVRLIKPLKTFPYNYAYTWGGDESTSPKRIIQSMNIKSGSNLVQAPLSSYADLGNPTRMWLMATEIGFRLIIKGGDASGSYTATLEFSKNEIVRRKVTSGEFPDNVWEETSFSFNHLNN